MDFIKQFKTALEQMTPQQRAQYIKLIALDPQLSDISTPIICFIKKYYEVDSNAYKEKSGSRKETGKC